MRLIDSCYFCYTPYQIIAAVSLVRQKRETADLYVFLSETAGYIDLIKKENIFSEVRFIKIQRNRVKNQLISWTEIVGSYLQFNRIAKKTLIPQTRYTNWYVSTRNLIDRCVFFYYVKNNISIRRIHFDDGAGSYFNDFLTYIGKKDALIRKIFFGEKALQRIESIALYSPELYCMLHGESQNKIEKISGNFRDKDTVKIYNRIFRIEESDLIKEPIVLLDCRKEEFLDKREQDKLSEIYQNIFEKCGTDNIIVKRHPRDAEKKRDGINYYENYRIPLECVYMNIDCNAKVLISVSSTAVVTPKLLLNQEPYVILLYKLLQIKRDDMNLKDLNLYYQNCKKLYSKPERFMMPETLNELNKCLNQVIKNLEI